VHETATGASGQITVCDVTPVQNRGPCPHGKAALEIDQGGTHSGNCSARGLQPRPRHRWLRSWSFSTSSACKVSAGLFGGSCRSRHLGPATHRVTAGLVSRCASRKCASDAAPYGALGPLPAGPSIATVNPKHTPSPLVSTFAPRTFISGSKTERTWVMGARIHLNGRRRGHAKVMIRHCANRCPSMAGHRSHRPARSRAPVRFTAHQSGALVHFDPVGAAAPWPSPIRSGPFLERELVWIAAIIALALRKGATTDTPGYSSIHRRAARAGGTSMAFRFGAKTLPADQPTGLTALGPFILIGRSGPHSRKW